MVMMPAAEPPRPVRVVVRMVVRVIMRMIVRVGVAHRVGIYGGPIPFGMPALRRLRPTLHSVRSITELASARPAYAAGIRAAIATVVPLLLAQLAGGGETWMSIGGFNVALADRGGPYRTRARVMASTAVATAVAIALGTAAAGSLGMTILLTFVVALVTSLARVWGAAGAGVGGAALTAFVIAIAFASTGATDSALLRAALVIAGGLWAMAIALVLWPLQPFRPARLAVAQSHRALAAYIADVALRLRATPPTRTSELPVGGAAMRTALEEARFTLAQSRRGRPGSTGREERLVVLGEIADQLFVHVVAVAESIDSIHAVSRIPAVDDAIVAALDDATRTAHALAAAVEAERGSADIRVTWSGEAVRAALTLHPPDAEAREQYGQVATMLDRAAQYATAAASTVAALNDGEPPAERVAAPLATESDDPVSPLAALREAMSPDSLILRYALRVAVVTSAAVSLSAMLRLERGYWMTITAIVILQPYTGVTAQRTLQRVAGTVVGGLLTAALGALFHDPRAILVLAFIFAATCVALLPVNYAAFSIFLTPTFVLLAEASTGDWHLAGTRVINTLLGGVLALAGSQLLWPSPEKKRLPGYMAAALRANRDYLDRVVSLFADRSTAAGHAMSASRRAAGLATMNAEESFQRMLGESGDARRLSSAMTFVTYARRLSASIAALALARHSAPELPQATLRDFADSALRVLDDLAEAIESGRAPAPLPTIVSADAMRASAAEVPPLLRARFDRLARQIRLVHDAIGRWSSADDSRPAW